MGDIEDHAAGCLLALACADALGGAVEFRDRADLDRVFPSGIHGIMGGGPHNLAVGEYTDDTSMALAIARGCTAEGIDLDAVADNFVAWYQSGPTDIGIATANALHLIASGCPWQEAGERLQAASMDGVAGNGAVMRCAPLALRFRSAPERLCQASIETARMTHADPRATWGTVALNQAIVHMLNGGTMEGLVAAATLEIEEPRVRGCIEQSPYMVRDNVRSSGYVLDTLNAAFWCVLTTSTIEDAITTAVELGWDTDTTGAVTGALAGAHYGAAALPSRWLNVLHDREEIAGLARQLIAWDATSSL